ncbi:MAG: acetylglucosamine-6-sulfatase [Flavobacteriaceae bacterium TMED171]|nr:MAG: acetylglucosamine-6-sulfatase [Flavobacteriaceae bacterium TMED171]|tara:strand:- start:2830 stop:4296 length:1467 start_codon:yes stop_codon:yes gene_type:complete
MINKILFISLFVISKSIVAQDKRPNIIFFLVDDQRYDMMSIMEHPFIETPNIDKLAKRSVYFKKAFVTTSLCSPSRASMITGQYAHKHNVIDNNSDLDPKTPTYPKELQKAGYNTGFIGKWHMGEASDKRRPGFDYWVSFEGQGKYINPELNIDGDRKEVKGHISDVLTDLAVGYIKSQTDKDEAYFLCISHKAVHENFTPTLRHHRKYINKQITYPDSYANTEENYKGKPDWLKQQRKSWHGAERNYAGGDKIEGDDLARMTQLYAECMLGVDESLGRLVNTLEDLGKLENTAIIYMSDNGYLLGEHGLIDKRVMYEESIRVPAFLYWGEKIKEGTINDEFVLNIDIAPTILDIAGVEIPDTMHGESFLPLALGEALDWRQDFLYEYFIDPMAVQTPTIFGLRTKQYSYITYHGVWDNFELYDIKKDPNQKDNLLGEVVYGLGYGNFIRHAVKQFPKMAPTLKKLDNRIDEILNETEGKRRPIWCQN